MSKIAKIPPLSAKTKLLSFDLETNGLHGKAFAVGAVLMGADGTVHDEFSARCEIEGDVDPWVSKNVLPAITNMPVTQKTYRELREAFWQWYLQAEPKSDYVLVNNGYPVEYRFLIECQEANLEERYWQHPFPILDLTSLLLQIGQKVELTERLAIHHPVNDAKTAARTAFKAFELAGRIP